MSLLSNYTVIGGKASEDLAKKIASKLKAKYLKSELRIFPDGESKITITARNVSAIPELVKYFKKLNLKDPHVLSLDSGGITRARDFANQFGVKFIALDKHRDRKNGMVQIRSKNQKQVKGRDLILVDDMISTGGSIVKAAEFLKKQKCRKIYAACTHALLIGDAEKRIRKAGVTRIVSTNTIPGKTGLVDVSPIIAKAIV